MRQILGIFALIACALCTHADAVPNSVTPGFVSQYGQIQNVQNYSSNPFWYPNRSYNQGMPVPVNVTGPDLSTADCITTVSVLISAFCGTNNNCTDMQLVDIRPTIVLQLSRLPGHNYATSCIGYIDSEFDKYKKDTQNTVPNHVVPFPTGLTDINPDIINDNTQIPNTYTPQVPEWKQEMIQRQQQLKQLQSQNGASDNTLAHNDFPQTYEDLSFSERISNEAQGHEAFKDEVVYHGINIKNYNDYIAHQTQPEIQEDNDNTEPHNPSDPKNGFSVKIIKAHDGHRATMSYIKQNDFTSDLKDCYLELFTSMSHAMSQLHEYKTYSPQNNVCEPLPINNLQQIVQELAENKLNKSKKCKAVQQKIINTVMTGKFLYDITMPTTGKQNIYFTSVKITPMNTQPFINVTVKQCDSELYTAPQKPNPYIPYCDTITQYVSLADGCRGSNTMGQCDKTFEDMQIAEGMHAQAIEMSEILALKKLKKPFKCLWDKNAGIDTILGIRNDYYIRCKACSSDEYITFQWDDLTDNGTDATPAQAFTKIGLTDIGNNKFLLKIGITDKTKLASMCTALDHMMGKYYSAHYDNSTATHAQGCIITRKM